jgi:hypothetical protein
LEAYDVAHHSNFQSIAAAPVGNKFDITVIRFSIYGAARTRKLPKDKKAGRRSKADRLFLLPYAIWLVKQ